MAISARIPDPFVVCVHRRGDVRYCALSQYIAKCCEVIKAGKFDDIEGLASAHEFGQQAREAIGAARKLLPWKQPAATEAAAETEKCPGCKTPLTRAQGGTFCFIKGCIFYVNADSDDGVKS